MSRYQNIIKRLALSDIPLSEITDRACAEGVAYPQVMADLLNVKEFNTIELAEHYEASALKDYIHTPLIEKGVYMLTDVADKVVHLKNNPQNDVGLPLKWLNVNMTLKPEIYVLTGIPGSGKSAWADNVIVNSVLKHGYKWSIFSPEQLPVQNHVKTLIEIATNSNFYGKYLTKETPIDIINESIRLLNDYLFFLNPPDDNALRIEKILEVMEEQVYDFGINAFILDPYNEFSHTRDMKISETEYVSHFFQKIRRFVKKHNCMAWIVAHPTKLRKNEDGTYPIPTAYDIAGSANFYNKADQIIVVHREKNRQKNPENIVQIVVQKVKHKGTGELGVYELKYIYGDGTYQDVPRMEEYK